MHRQTKTINNMEWGIYIRLGYKEEFELVKKQRFSSRKKAINWCKNNNYHTQCAMKVSEILEINPNYYDNI